MSESINSNQQSELTAVTAATVAPGLGYPADRIENSPEPTGWIAQKDNEEVGNVSRGTSK